MLDGPLRCCQCSANNVSVDKRSVIGLQEWSNLFDKQSSPCQNNQRYLDCKMCCSNAIKGLDYTKLSTIISRKLLDEFCPIRKAITVLIGLRNTCAHISEARITDADYVTNSTKAKQAILQIAKVCQKEVAMLQKLDDLSSRPLDEMMLLKYHAELIKQLNESELTSNVLKRYEDVIKKMEETFADTISQMQKLAIDIEISNTTKSKVSCCKRSFNVD
ncbi:Hypothetical predicted protein [Mytilus galloprovincialis]|uniref:DZIP3-like HEPN domain-containing protein n=1 Tax=Mytilus galloprovincialis TaxID=29158 RepID=A0A8B6CVR8_MYTGA|nr:Hypothetical predicted protein [Mytilus galloprovincialis]